MQDSEEMEEQAGRIELWGIRAVGR